MEYYNTNEEYYFGFQFRMRYNSKTNNPSLQTMDNTVIPVLIFTITTFKIPHHPPQFSLSKLRY